jgi:MoaA/NifB/PqqE/SkfB family radical SAM enzyme
MAGVLHEAAKQARYAAAFLARRLVHTNLQILYQCNMRCQICDFWRPNHARRRRLAPSEVAIIAAKLAALGPQIVSIGGGEPLLHPAIVRIVEILARDHFPVMICNGWYVTPELAGALFRAGVYEVSVSVDYADAARHDAQRGVDGAHARALAGLATLARARVHAWQRVHMISVVMDDNVDDVERLIQLSRALGVTSLVTLYSDGRGRAERRARRPEIGARLQELKARYPEFVQLRGYLGRFGEAIRDGGVGPCMAGRNLCNVDSDGDVSLCIDRIGEPVGNLLRDEAPVIERRLRAAHAANDCRGCWTSCRGAIETLMYGGDRLGNLRDYHAMTRRVALGE